MSKQKLDFENMSQEELLVLLEEIAPNRLTQAKTWKLETLRTHVKTRWEDPVQDTDSLEDLDAEIKDLLGNGMSGSIMENVGSFISRLFAMETAKNIWKTTKTAGVEVFDEEIVHALLSFLIRIVVSFFPKESHARKIAESKTANILLYIVFAYAVVAVASILEVKYPRFKGVRMAAGRKVFHHTLGVTKVLEKLLKHVPGIKGYFKTQEELDAIKIKEAE